MKRNIALVIFGVISGMISGVSLGLSMKDAVLDEAVRTAHNNAEMYLKEHAMRIRGATKVYEWMRDEIISDTLEEEYAKAMFGKE